MYNGIFISSIVSSLIIFLTIYIIMLFNGFMEEPIINNILSILFLLFIVPFIVFIIYFILYVYNIHNILQYLFNIINIIIFIFTILAIWNFNTKFTFLFTGYSIQMNSINSIKNFNIKNNANEVISTKFLNYYSNYK